MPSVIRQIPLDTATRHHAHDYHQIVIGLQGRAEFEIEGLGGAISALSGCIVPANHVHYYAGTGDNRQLILDLPAHSPALSGPHQELASLFDAPRFFTLDDPLRHYLRFLLLELERSGGMVTRGIAWPPPCWAACTTAWPRRLPSSRPGRRPGSTWPTSSASSTPTSPAA